jgi:two-component system, response regulator PdtaR
MLPLRSSPHDDGSRSVAPQSGAPRILIAEDDYLISGLMQLELAAAGFDVVGVARSAGEAVDLAVEHRPHLVVMDIQLQGARDGVEAAIDIFKCCGIRSLFASAFHTNEMRTRAEACSPLGWVAKPYTMGLLVDAVRSALGSGDLRRDDKA